MDIQDILDKTKKRRQEKYSDNISILVKEILPSIKQQIIENVRNEVYQDFRDLVLYTKQIT